MTSDPLLFTLCAWSPEPARFVCSRAPSTGKMWLEVLPSFMIITGCIAVSGIALKYLDQFENKGKVRWVRYIYIAAAWNILPRDPYYQPRRYRLDEWDHSMVQRDKRITGSIYKQQVRGGGWEG